MKQEEIDNVVERLQSATGHYDCPNQKAASAILFLQAKLALATTAANRSHEAMSCLYFMLNNDEFDISSVKLADAKRDMADDAIANLRRVE